MYGERVRFVVTSWFGLLLAVSFKGLGRAILSGQLLAAPTELDSGTKAYCTQAVAVFIPIFQEPGKINPNVFAQHGASGQESRSHCSQTSRAMSAAKMQADPNRLE